MFPLGLRGIFPIIYAIIYITVGKGIVVDPMSVLQRGMYVYPYNIIQLSHVHN